MGTTCQPAKVKVGSRALCHETEGPIGATVRNSRSTTSGGDRVRFVGRVAVFVLSSWAGAVGLRSMIATKVARRQPGHGVPLELTPNVIAVDSRLWRGPAPPADGYAELSSAGVSLVVDLRSEVDVAEAEALAGEAQLELLVLPTEDARAPRRPHVEQFSHRMSTTPGVTYVHCRAGEGRTGALIGALQVADGEPVGQTLSDALAIGSLTFSQLAYVASAGRTPALASFFEWYIDRPTEYLFDVLRRKPPLDS